MAIRAGMKRWHFLPPDKKYRKGKKRALQRGFTSCVRLPEWLTVLDRISLGEECILAKVFRGKNTELASQALSTTSFFGAYLFLQLQFVVKKKKEN